LLRRQAIAADDWPTRL